MSMSNEGSLSAPMAFISSMGLDFRNPADLAAAWSYVNDLGLQGRPEVARRAANALHLLLGNIEHVASECQPADLSLPGWKEARYVHNPYSREMEWPMELHMPVWEQGTHTPYYSSPTASLCDASSEQGHPHSCPLPHLLLRWIPASTSEVDETRAIAEGRLSDFGTLSHTSFVTVENEVRLSVWFQNPADAPRAQLLTHGTVLKGDTRVFVRLGEPEEGPEPANNRIIAEFERKRNKHGLTPDARTVGFLFDTFQARVGNVEHVALVGTNRVEVKFLSTEASCAALGQDVIYPRWVIDVRGIPDEVLWPSSFCSRRSSSSSTSNGISPTPSIPSSDEE